jgi:hypothetical protein
MEIEAASMQLLRRCCPQHIPELFCYDPAHSVLAMQYLAQPHQKLLYWIRQGQVCSCSFHSRVIDSHQPQQLGRTQQHQACLTCTADICITAAQPEHIQCRPTGYCVPPALRNRFAQLFPRVFHGTRSVFRAGRQGWKEVEQSLDVSEAWMSQTSPCQGC